MIKSIRLNSEKAEGEWGFNHAFRCPKIIDRTFEFGPSLNIICGYNGSGKSTLLNAIRSMTFCDKQMFSRVAASTHTACGISNMVAEGFYDKVELWNDWNKSVFSIRPSDEVDGTNFEDSAVNLMQMLDSKKRSDGMDTVISFMQLLDIIKNNRLEDTEDIKDFKKMVLDAPMCYGHGGTPPSINNSTNSDMCKKIREYIASHHVDSDKYTVILDEPDRSVDVCMIDSLYSFLVPRKGKQFKNQYLVVFHNPIVLYKLYKEHKDEINWIELTPGYLDNIIRFTEGRPVIRPTEMDWTCKD